MSGVAACILDGDAAEEELMPRLVWVPTCVKPCRLANMPDLLDLVTAATTACVFLACPAH